MKRSFIVCLAVLALAAAWQVRQAGAFPADLLKNNFGNAADSVSVPAVPQAVNVASAASMQKVAYRNTVYGNCVAGRCQAVASPRNPNPRGPHGSYWTHQCYRTAQEAGDAAIATCERQSGGFTCTADAYTADRCDR